MSDTNFNAIEGKKLIDYTISDEKIDYIGGMYPRGRLSALMGNGMAGKSWSLVRASLSITSGLPFLPTNNYTPTDNEGVLIIDTEVRVEDYVKRINTYNGKLDNYAVPVDFRHTCSFNKNDKEKIEKTIETDKYSLVIVDSFSGFSNVDENSYQVMECLKWLLDLTLKYNVAVVYTQYVNKTEVVGKLTYKSMRGFSGLSQMPVNIWAIESVTNDQKRLYQVKNNIGKIDKNEYHFDSSSENFDLIDVVGNQSRNDIFLSNKQLENKDVLKLLMDNEPSISKTAMTRWLERKRITTSAT